MKRLLMTTALVAMAASPIAAEQSDNTASGSDVMAPANQMTLKASDLFGHRIYLPGSEGTTDQTGASMPLTEVPDSWKMAGEIHDVVLTKDGQVTALIVDAGGFLGVGETERRIDIQDVRFTPDADDEGAYFIVYNGDKSMFQNTSRFDDRLAENAGELLGTENMVLDRPEPATVAFADVSTDDLLGAVVYGANSEWVGEISKLTLAENGKVDAIIIDIGGFLGIGEKPVALGVDQVSLRRLAAEDTLRAYVDLTEGQLENMRAWKGES